MSSLRLAIKRHRERIGLTQKELANSLGVTENTVANWESGRSGVDQFARTFLLCKGLNCTPNDLVEVGEDE